MSEPTEQQEQQDLSQVLEDRREKLERIREAGIEPFPHEFSGREDIAEVRAAHQGLAAGMETDSRHRVAGRLVGRRGHGKACFLDLRDGSGQIQLHARKDVLGDEAYEILVDLDLGDIIGAEGTAMATRRGGELSLAIDHWRLLAKSLRPPPDKFHGLEDTETRFRRRELDLIANEESRRTFRARARTISEIRRWFDEHDFVEVETPVLQPLYGGALARPFTTHHNALDRDFYLRIATELYLKRLVVGGIDRVYELGKDFRNEGVSHKHNPEFTMLEWYEAYELLVDLDLGDVIGAEGTAMATRRGGELSLAVDRWRLLAKSLRPPPDKFHGLEDTETRFRRRELDLIANGESRRTFRARARTISEIRRWFDEHDFVEVETPV
ncbi:MAG TPA: amino acid--tRNA ligase-related protein, partial [Solirubrobacterales bacterium]|nr:amino acid--tRNA ligase-related protein [Solirubrobacterales bacterium]